MDHCKTREIELEKNVKAKDSEILQLRERELRLLNEIQEKEHKIADRKSRMEKAKNIVIELKQSMNPVVK
jgi:septal ring factor EnvC (AmiA/AmiB activator)